MNSFPNWTPLDFIEHAQADKPALLKSLKILNGLPGSHLVSMSGSGPSCFALFPNYDDANKVLKEHFNEFERAGLSAWACSMMSNGVQLKNEFT